MHISGCTEDWCSGTRMSRSSHSYSVDDELHKIIAEMPGSNSDVVNAALRRYLITDTDVLESRIDELEKKKQRKQIEKQQAEQVVWDLDDQIEDLKNLRTRARAVEDVKNQIGKDRIEKVTRIVKKNKYDHDARAYTETEAIEKHVELIQDDHPELPEEKIRETLKMFINV